MNQQDGLKKWQTKDSKIIIEDRWIKLRSDTCITATGHELAPYYVLEYNDWVGCLVISDDGEVTMLRHYRYGADEYVLEVMGGGVDKGETPETTARRELEEELGVRNADIHCTGSAYPNPSNQTNKVHFFVAIGGTFDGNAEDEIGADFVPVKMPLKRLLEIIENQEEVMQSMHLTCIFFALNHLRKIGKLPA